MSDWIRMLDRRPHVGQLVLAAITWEGFLDFDLVKRLRNGGYWGEIKSGLTDEQVTHWMPLERPGGEVAA